MKKFLSLAVLALVVGCSNPVSIGEQMLTVGLDKNIEIKNNTLIGSFDVLDIYGTSTESELYFYVPVDFQVKTSGILFDIPDGSMFVDGRPFNNLSCKLLCDVDGNWYMQIVRYGNDLCMPVGSKVVIYSFTVRW